MSRQTRLYPEHLKRGARFIDFSGWQMPLHYGSQLEEHRQVRQSVGLFDVSHMGIVDIVGTSASDFLRYLLANDVAKLRKPGKAFYTCMLNEAAGVLDDLIVYYLARNHYRLVVNAGTCQTDIDWIRSIAKGRDVDIIERSDLSIIAVQGRNTFSLLGKALSEAMYQSLSALRPFEFFISDQQLIARTGYTGEVGVEILLPNDLVVSHWQALLNTDLDVLPCGLAARDTLRLEAGFNLYGQDMDINTSPLVSNLEWTISFKDLSRDFVGRRALEREKSAGVQKKLVGLVMKEPGVLRNGQTVWVEGVGEGKITSGSFSPILGYSIALARVPIETEETAEIERRGKRVTVSVVKPPFYTAQG